jgi:putative tryptophan/tyrosine transport system substrate-binding protein
MPTIGIMHSGSQGKHDAQIKAFKGGLDWGGATPGAPVTIAGPLYADDDPAKLDAIAAKLVGSDKVDVLVAAGGSASCEAAKKGTATTRTPVVFTSVANPTRPAANMTGICARTSELDSIRLSLLQELLPGKKRFGALVNPSRFNCVAQKDHLSNAATLLGLQAPDYKDINSGDGKADTDIDRAFADWASGGCAGVLVTADPLFNNHRERVIRAAGAPNNVPAIYQWREFAEGGGLMSYGPDLTVAYTLAGTYVGRILKGTAIGDLPVLPLNNFELVINLKTAKALGIDVPPALLARADLIVG